MKKKIITINPGRWDAFVKALKQLSFLSTIQIYDSCLTAQVKTNAWLCVDFSFILGSPRANLSFLNITNGCKELTTIPSTNVPIEIYESDQKYIFTNGGAYVSLPKYAGFNKRIEIPNHMDSEIQMGTTSSLIKSDTETMFKLVKNKGPIDFAVIEDELIFVGNTFGSRFPVVKNNLKDVIETEPTDIFRSFSFDKIDGKIVDLELFKVPEDPDWHPNMPSTWLYAQITIDTAIVFNFFERLIPVSKINWRID